MKMLEYEGEHSAHCVKVQVDCAQFQRVLASAMLVQEWNKMKEVPSFS